MFKNLNAYPFLFSYLLVSYCLFQTQAVPAQNCPGSTAETDLNVNNTRVRLQNGGDFWWDGFSAGYIFPTDATQPNGIASIYAGGLWLAGLTPTGDLKVAASTYGRSTGKRDFWPGPLTPNEGNTTPMDCKNFDRFWKVYGFEISGHQADWADNGQIDNTIPANVLGWPARGNPHFESIYGFQLPDNVQAMAPFTDVDSNGKYEPMKGDSPNIHGADEGIWWVFNDAGGTHTESGGAPLKFEVQVLAYAFASSENAINNSTFYDFKIINRGIETIDSAYAGIWLDPDLGCYADDYIGSDPDNDLAYVYNQDAKDGDANCYCDGINTYCDEVPILAVKVLKGTLGLEQGQWVDQGLSNLMYYLNRFLGAPHQGMTDPRTPAEYYNYLSGSWRDGKPLTYGGLGYSLSNPPRVHHAFPNAPNEQGGWSMCEEALPVYDHRMLLSSGPFRLDPGAITPFSIAVIMVPDVPLPCPDLGPLDDACKKVDELYELITDTKDAQYSFQHAGFQLYPNPMGNATQLVSDNPTIKINAVNLYAMDGRLLRSYENVDASVLEIEKGKLAHGLYYLRIVTVDGKWGSMKLMVN